MLQRTETERQYYAGYCVALEQLLWRLQGTDPVEMSERVKWLQFEAGMRP